MDLEEVGGAQRRRVEAAKERTAEPFSTRVPSSVAMRTPTVLTMTSSVAVMLIDTPEAGRTGGPGQGYRVLHIPAEVVARQFPVAVEYIRAAFRETPWIPLRPGRERLALLARFSKTAQWASTPIALGPGAQLTPMVLGPEGVPVVTDADTAHLFPELALLSVMAHGQGDVQTAVNIARVAAAAASDLASDNQALYLDLIESALGEAARKAFEMLPETYKFQGPSYLRGKARGKAEGEARGKAEGILAVLEARGLAVSGEQRQRILECTDSDCLGMWVRKAVTLTDINEPVAQ